jgi:ribosome-binding protein aMBF1 (putative translation factor)
MNKNKAAGATRDTDMEIAHRINKARVTSGIRKEDLAEKIGISYTSLRRILEQERGDRRSPTTRELSKIAEVLQVKTSTLLPEEFKQDAA